MNETIQKKKNSLSDFQGLLFVFEVGEVSVADPSSCVKYRPIPLHTNVVL